MLLATVEGSGTHAAFAILGRSVRAIREFRLSARDPGVVVWAHCDNATMPLIHDLAAHVPLITTERPLEDIRMTWITRGKDLRGLSEQWANYRALLHRCAFVLRLGQRLD